MSISNAFSTGLTGLQAQGMALGVIGDNIANVNTLGFKAGRANFEAILNQTTLGGGAGVVPGNVQRLFGQGSLEYTGNPLDMAVAGGGFLVVRDPSDSVGQPMYTRAGAFTLDTDGYVATPEGLRLQGYSAQTDGSIGGPLGDLKLGDVTSPPKATSDVSLALNLDPSSELLTAPWDPADPDATSNYSSSVTLYDAQGNAIQADVYYRKTADNQWDYHVLVDGESIEGGTAGTPVEITSGQLAFNTDGTLAAQTAATVSFTPAGPGVAQNLTFTLSDASQVAGESATSRLSQDGYGAGELRDITIDDQGIIHGAFSNGAKQDLGQVALADFMAPEGLEPMSNNMWRATGASGEAAVAGAGEGNRGSIASGALEGSNVDLTHEFVKMIAAQRGFQASSKTISTADEMLAEVINLSR